MLSLRELDDDAVFELLGLAPFGFGNAAPLLGVSGWNMRPTHRALRLTSRTFPPAAT